MNLLKTNIFGGNEKNRKKKNLSFGHKRRMTKFQSPIPISIGPIGKNVPRLEQLAFR